MFSVLIVVIILWSKNQRAVAIEAFLSNDRSIEEFCPPGHEEMGVGDVWFQQDGATAHTARATADLLREHFPHRFTALRGGLPLPARSPDLKSLVYVNRQQTQRATRCT